MDNIRDKSLTLCLFVILWISASITISAQSIYPLLSPSVYYNMDTTAIIIGEDAPPKTSYTREELDRIFDGSWDPDSSMLAVPYEEVPCTKIGNISLPLRIVTDSMTQNIVDEIIRKTLADGYSSSPDELISRGIFFHISFYKDWHTPTLPIVLDIDVQSNYYFGDTYKYIQRDHDSNIFCCYHRGIIGIVSFSDDTLEKSIKQFFSTTDKRVTLHLYKKQRMKLLLHSNMSDDRDVHSTVYGLYRRYVLDNSIWIEHYYETDTVSH